MYSGSFLNIACTAIIVHLERDVALIAPFSAPRILKKIVVDAVQFRSKQLAMSDQA